MPSRVIRPTEAPVAAPFAYTVGATEGLSPEAVVAAWDGTGAGGDFLPCVSFYNAEGVLMDRAFPDGATLSPGDTAEVSYRPFRRGVGPGGAVAALVTADGVSTVDPTDELFVAAGLTLTDFSPIAILGAATARYALAAQAPALQILGNGGVVAFAATIANGVVAAGNAFTAQTSGEYFVYAQAQVTVGGAQAAGTTIGLSSARSSGGQFYFANSVTPVAVPGGQVWQVQASCSRPYSLLAGQSVQFKAASNGPNVQIGGGIFAIFGLS